MASQFSGRMLQNWIERKEINSNIIIIWSSRYAVCYPPTPPPSKDDDQGLENLPLFCYFFRTVCPPPPPHFQKWCDMPILLFLDFLKCTPQLFVQHSFFKAFLLNIPFMWIFVYFNPLNLVRYQQDEKRREKKVFKWRHGSKRWTIRVLFVERTMTTVNICFSYAWLSFNGIFFSYSCSRLFDTDRRVITRPFGSVPESSWFCTRNDP